jgi:acetylornithine deacetylase/succinyl-diaminopimelate desuccinylase-like protein
MLDKILAAAEAHFEDHVTRLQRFIRQPSVSAESRGNDEMAAMLAERFVFSAAKRKSCRAWIFRSCTAGSIPERRELS